MKMELQREIDESKKIMNNISNRDKDEMVHQFQEKLLLQRE
jgi:hypothetical protein